MPWDVTYETLRAGKPRIIEEHDALLTRELPASLSTSPDDTGIDSPGPFNAAALVAKAVCPPARLFSQPSANRATLDRLAKMELERMDSKRTKLRIFGREFVVWEQVSRVASGVPC